MSKLFKFAQKFNCFYLNGLAKGDCCPFLVEGVQVGLVRPDVYKHLLEYPDVFCRRKSNIDEKVREVVELNPAFRDYEERTARVDEVLKEFREKDLFKTLRGWRNEYFDVGANGKSFFKMDRSATYLFGIRKYGVYINGYVRHPTKGLCIWFQHRSHTKQTWPGKWDLLVGGGLSVGYSIMETAVKESAEEASIPEHLTKKLASVGCVSFFFECELGLSANTEFVFDLELPVDFIPFNADGEVQGFELLPISECLEKVFSPDFKTTGIPVAVDFLIRHGIVTPENESNFTQVVELLHVPLQSLYNYQVKPRDKSMENGD